MGHSGSCPGYRSTLWIERESRIGAAALANASGIGTELFVRRVRDDGDLGETVVFEEDETGRVVALVQHSNRYPRIE